MEEIKKDILLEDLNLKDTTKRILKQAGYKTIEDLTASKVEDVGKLFIDMSHRDICDYNEIYEFRYLKAVLHCDFKVTFVGEYDSLSLTSEIANIPIMSLELPSKLKQALTKNLIWTFGDLLTTDYKILLKTNNLGEIYLRVLKNYVHSLGYILKNEEPTLKETLETLKEKGIKLLEETIDNQRICMVLYRNGIYSIEDLLNFGPDVFNLVGFGPVKKQQLLQKMQELNLSFKTPSLECLQQNAIFTDGTFEQARIGNNEIRIRIDQKEKLIAEYDRLMAEKQQLLAREQELNRLIEAKLSVMNEVISHGRK